MHANTRQDLHPNPADDAVQVIFLFLKDERHPEEPPLALQPPEKDIVISWGDPTNRGHVKGAQYIEAADELDLFNHFIEVVLNLDPDMLLGFETQKNSLGYLIERYRSAYGLNLCQEISRIQVLSSRRKDGFADEHHEGWEYRHSSGIHITGRNVLNVWRILKSDIALTSYSYENFVFHVLHERVPYYSFETLTHFYTHTRPSQRWRVFDHYLARTHKTFDFIAKLDVVDQTSEFARVFGTDFFSILTRGSQYKVESVMLRVSKANNFIALSPSAQQVRVFVSFFSSFSFSFSFSSFFISFSRFLLLFLSGHNLLCP